MPNDNFAFTPVDSDCGKHSVGTNSRSVLQLRPSFIKMLPLDIGTANCMNFFSVLLIPLKTKRVLYKDSVRTAL
jgi:hypothetical protein